MRTEKRLKKTKASRGGARAGGDGEKRDRRGSGNGCWEESTGDGNEDGGSAGRAKEMSWSRSESGVIKGIDTVLELAAISHRGSLSCNWSRYFTMKVPHCILFFRVACCFPGSAVCTSRKDNCLRRQAASCIIRANDRALQEVSFPENIGLSVD